LLITAVIWGTSFVAQRAAMDNIGPMLFNGLRFALGALVILPLAFRSERITLRHKLTTPRALAGGLVAGVILFLGASFQQVGLLYTTAGKAGFITGLYVVIVPILGLFLGQRTGLGKWVGALFAVVGMYFLSVTESFTVGLGDLLQLGGAFFWAFHVLLVGYLALKTHPIRLACIQFVACAALSLLVAIPTESITVSGISAAGFPIIYGGLLSVGVGYTLQVIAQRDAIPTHAAILLSLEAVFAALAGWALLDEHLDARGILGCVLMLVGMLVAQLAPFWHRRWRAKAVSLPRRGNSS
jgi:drug/metabolite transporter (DMT)-like permease